MHIAFMQKEALRFEAKQFITSETFDATNEEAEPFDSHFFDEESDSGKSRGSFNSEAGDDESHDNSSSYETSSTLGDIRIRSNDSEDEEEDEPEEVSKRRRRRLSDKEEKAVT